MHRPEIAAKVAAKNLGRHHTPEARARIGLAQLGERNCMKRPEVRARHAEVVASDVYRQKLREASPHRSPTPELLARLSERMLNLSWVEREEMVLAMGHTKRRQSVEHFEALAS